MTGTAYKCDCNFGYQGTNCDEPSKSDSIRALLFGWKYSAPRESGRTEGPVFHRRCSDQSSSSYSLWCCDVLPTIWWPVWISSIITHVKATVQYFRVSCCLLWFLRWFSLLVCGRNSEVRWSIIEMKATAEQCCLLWLNKIPLNQVFSCGIFKRWLSRWSWVWCCLSNDFEITTNILIQKLFLLFTL